ncbi:hypothetical protein MFLAVUS_008428 [Mucor flavus]|uniref:Uncharacterized protein n=1 Tax=Mucor flavus TaxID=439312 RepID=A0ABP9Z738_9FUNG
MDLDEDPAMTYNKLVLLVDETTVPRVEIVSNQLNNSEEEVLYEISEEGPNDNTKDPSLIEENIKIKHIDYLHPSGLNDVLFANTIKSDGFTVDFLFEKRRATARQESKNDIENHDLALKDFKYEEVERMYHPIFIDSGRKAVRRSTKEYYNLTGSTKYSSRLQRLKNMKDLTIIETNIPTQKTCSSISYERFIQYIINYKDKLFDFYGKVTAKDRFFYVKNVAKKQQQNRKSGKWKPSMFHEKDKSKVPLIVFGNEMFGKDLVKLKGLRCGVVGIMWRCLKKREAAVDLVVVTVDEFKTSRICCRCGTDSLDDVAHVEGHSVLV